eukprot:c22699_g1_i1 orf=86-568(+)
MALSPLFVAAGRGNSFDPFQKLGSLFSSPFEDVDDFSSPFQMLLFGSSAFNPMQMDCKETPESVIYEAKVPAGLRKEDIKLHVEEQRVLSISGENATEDGEAGENWNRFERSYGSFLKQFRLPQNAKPDEMTANVENGILTIKVPKDKFAQPTRKQIQFN